MDFLIWFQKGQRFIGEIYLLVSVLFYGTAFVVMRYAMFYKLGPQSFNAGRFFIASICLIVTKFGSVDLPTIRIAGNEGAPQPKGSIYSTLLSSNTLLWGGLLGVLNFIASSFQQAGLATVDANRAGFVIGMYVVFVPIVEQFVPGLNGKLTARSWTAALMSIAGLYLMSGCAEVAVCTGGSFGQGEMYTLVSMAVWVVFIIGSSIASKIVDPITLTMINFIVATMCSIVCGMIMEPAVWVFPLTAFTDEWFILCVVGVFLAAGFALSTLGQRFTSPTMSALIMSLETVVCAVVSYLTLHETLSVMETLGCVMMLWATVVAIVQPGVCDQPGSDEGDGVERDVAVDARFDEAKSLLENVIDNFDVEMMTPSLSDLGPKLSSNKLT